MDKVQISITPSTIFTAIVVCLAAWILWILRDLVLLVVTAVVVASAIEPGISFLMKHHFHRTFAALSMYLVVFGALIALVFAFVPPVLNDSREFLQVAPDYIGSLALPQSVVDFSNSAQTLLQGNQTSLADTISTFAPFFAGSARGATQLASGIFSGIFSFFLVVVLSFYFAVQETGVDDFLRLVSPVKYEEYVIGLWRRSQKKIGLWMQGQLLLSIIVGTVVYLGLLILGVPYALLLALLAAVLDLIPIFGSLTAGVVGTLIAFISGGFALAVLVAGLYFIVNQFEANLIYPLIVDKVVGVPPLMVIIALIAGGTLAGFLGVLLSIPLAATFREFLNDYDTGKRSKIPS